MRALWIASVLVLVLAKAKAQNYTHPCKNTQWRLDSTCPAHTSEVYRETLGLSSRRMCCRNPNNTIESHLLEATKRAATGCRTTHCRRVSNNSRSYDMCSTEFPTRKISSVHFDIRRIAQEFGNGRRSLAWTLEYEEEIKESCVPGIPGAQGVTAVCCPTVADGALLAMYAAEMHEFPYIAHLFEHEIQKGCGAAIYNNLHVITAAHCVMDTNKNTLLNISHLTITVGTNIGQLLTNVDHDDRVFKPERMFVHRNYKSRGCKSNDIAVIKLNRKIKFNSHVQPIQIAPVGFDPLVYGTHAIMAGWGVASNMRMIPFLRKTNLRIRDDRQCFNYGDKNNSQAWSALCDNQDRTGQFICIGGLEDSEVQDPAYSNPIVLSQGDSGSPVVCKDANGNAVLCGIVSFGGDFEMCLTNRNAKSCPFSAASEVQSFSGFIVRTAGTQNGMETYKYKPYGIPVGANEFLHQVRVVSETGKTRSCGGTLIWKNLVLTAGHCVKDDNERYLVQVGVRDLADMSRVEVFRVARKRILDGFKLEAEKAIWLRISMFVHHERKFKLPIDDKLYERNLAVLVLERNVDVSDDQLPVIRDFDFAARWPPSGDAYEVGFMRKNNRSNNTSSVLMKRKLTLLHRSECVERAKRAHVDSLGDDLICTIERGSGGSLCDRELGGGLFCGPKSRVLCGVQIFRTCQTNAPGLFVNVALYRDWIKESVSGGGGSSGGATSEWSDWITRTFQGFRAFR